MPQNKNEILKDIALSLGGTVTKKDNDTNELLAIIRDNVSGGAGGSGGGSGYLHLLEVGTEDAGSGSGKFKMKVLTNFDEPISLDNIHTTIFNKFVEMYMCFIGSYGSHIVSNDISISYSNGVSVTGKCLVVQNGSYPGSNSKYIKLERIEEAYKSTITFNVDGTISYDNTSTNAAQQITKITSITDTVIPL